jgi:hypothetical protein
MKMQRKPIFWMRSSLSASRPTLQLGGFTHFRNFGGNKRRYNVKKRNFRED